MMEETGGTQMARFLVVDDSSSVRQFFQCVLAGHGECDMAVDGVEGVKLAGRAFMDNRPYDVIFLDIMMPQISGLTACRKIRDMERAAGLSQDGPCRIVMVSSLSDSGTMLKAQFESGADAYLTKPVEPAAIREILCGFGLEGSALADLADEDC